MFSSFFSLQRLKRLFSVMLPILASQSALVGMQVCDVAMSGHAGAIQLAGSSVGSSIMLPVVATSIGLLMSSTPIIAQLIGKENYKSIGNVIKTGIVLALGIELILLITYFGFIDHILNLFTLTPEVAHISKYYILFLVLGLSFGLITFPLRSLVETVASTAVAMRIYLLALPINAILNYCFIFGHAGLPAYGGIGAGIATGLTYFIVFCLFILVIFTHPKLNAIKIINSKLQLRIFREYLKIGIPNSLGILMESSIFGFILIFVSKFGTNYTAAHQAAMNVASVCYVLPLSFSLALTIIIGIHVGAKRIDEAKKFARLAITSALVLGGLLAIVIFLGRKELAEFYSADPILIGYIPHFLIYVIAWQVFDAIACPIYGILRGYKDVTIPFIINVVSYWLICFPVGLALDYYAHQGAFAYWQGLVIGILVSAIFLTYRLKTIEKRFSKLA